MEGVVEGRRGRGRREGRGGGREGRGGGREERGR